LGCVLPVDGAGRRESGQRPVDGVSLVNNDSDFISLPATIFIPAGGTGATFNVLTAPVDVPTQVTMDSGTAFEGYACSRDKAAKLT
jgi:hypothetical protein